MTTYGLRRIPYVIAGSRGPIRVEISQAGDVLWFGSLSAMLAMQREYYIPNSTEIVRKNWRGKWVPA